MDLVIKDNSGGRGPRYQRRDSEEVLPDQDANHLVQVSAGSTYVPSLVPNLLVALRPPPSVHELLVQSPGHTLTNAFQSRGLPATNLVARPSIQFILAFWTAKTQSNTNRVTSIAKIS